MPSKKKTEEVKEELKEEVKEKKTKEKKPTAKKKVETKKAETKKEDTKKEEVTPSTKKTKKTKEVADVSKEEVKEPKKKSSKTKKKVEEDVDLELEEEILIEEEKTSKKAEKPTIDKDEEKEPAIATLDQVKEKLTNEAKAHDGVLSEDEINKILNRYDLNDEDQDEIFTFCQDFGILSVAVEDDLLDDDLLDNDLLDTDDDEGRETVAIEVEDYYPAADVKNADPVRQYLHQIGTYQVLKSKDEEVELAKRIIEGEKAQEQLMPEYEKYCDSLAADKTPDDFKTWCDNMEYPSDDNFEIWDLKETYLDGDEAKDRLIQCNLKLVVSIAKHYVNRGMDFLDLIQEGNLGLIKAVGKFDYTRGFKFSTYATWWIRQAITRALADQARTIRIPVHMVETINKITRAQRKLVQKLNRDPTPEEISEELGHMWSASRIVEIQQIALDPLSLEKPVGEEEDSHVGDFIVDKDNQSPYDYANEAMQRQRIDEVLDQLTDKEARIIRLRYGIGEDNRTHTLEEVGKEFNVTRERIRQIEAKALKKLRHPSRAKLLKDFANDL